MTKCENCGLEIEFRDQVWVHPDRGRICADGGAVASPALIDLDAFERAEAQSNR